MQLTSHWLLIPRSIVNSLLFWCYFYTRLLTICTPSHRSKFPTLDYFDMAEKIRYYLEQSVPELEDLQRKKLFAKNEITMIMRRRTDFEHRIQGRGTKPRDFLKYAEFETNLEKLRKKRFSRLSKSGSIDTKPSISDWAGIRRVLFIYERATRKFPRDMDVWSRYLKSAKLNGAIKVVYKVYSRLLQLQPRNVDAWLSAAKYEFETNANAKGARSLFQRGLRLNPDAFELWYLYTQFELTYISRLLARRKVLGLITEKLQKEEMDKEETKLKQALNADEDGDDVIQLPEADMKELLNLLPEADINMLGNPETNPALRGDVALTVFDLAVESQRGEHLSEDKRREKTMFAVEKYLQLFDQFSDLNRDYLYSHVIQYLQQKYPDDLQTMFIDITLPLRTTEPTASDFAESLQLSVNKFLAYKSRGNTSLTKKYVDHLNDRFMNPQHPAHLQSLLSAIIAKCST